MLDWSYMTLPEGKKVVIIDNVDQLETSSENVLLKRLEEPSDDLYFILLAENNSRVLQTIKSRCRAYYFKDLSNEAKNNVLQNIYLQNDPNIYSSIYEYFHQKSREFLKILRNEGICILLAKDILLAFLPKHQKTLFRQFLPICQLLQV